MSLQSLPPELLLSIAVNLHGSDLFHLLQTSRYSQQLLSTQLYIQAIIQDGGRKALLYAVRKDLPVIVQSLFSVVSSAVRSGLRTKLLTAIVVYDHKGINILHEACLRDSPRMVKTLVEAAGVEDMWKFDRSEVTTAGVEYARFGTRKDIYQYENDDGYELGEEEGDEDEDSEEEDEDTIWIELTDEESEESSSSEEEEDEDKNSETAQVCRTRMTKPRRYIDLGDHNGFTALHLAARRGLSDTVALLLQLGANINHGVVVPKPRKNEHRSYETSRRRLLKKYGLFPDDVSEYASGNETALQLAAYLGHITVVKLLLQKGADANLRCKDHWTPLHCAAFGGHQEVAEYLLDHGAEVGLNGTGYYNPVTHDGNLLEIGLAAIAGHEGIVKVLLKEGCTVENELLHDIIAIENNEMLKVLLTACRREQLSAPFGQHRRPLLRDVLLYGNSDVVGILLDAGADPDARAHWEDPIVQWVLENECSVSYISPSYSRHRHERPLVASGCVVDLNSDKDGYGIKVLEVLLKAGADPDAFSENNSDPPVVMAASRCLIHELRLLLEHGAKLGGGIKEQAIEKARNAGPEVIEREVAKVFREWEDMQLQTSLRRDT